MPSNTLHFPKLKRRTTYKRYGSYGRYRQEIREDCQGRCVYCDLHENALGGSECMVLDHFRPQAKYEELTNEPTNLVWACVPCNRYKSDHWPAFGAPGTVKGEQGFIDPFSEDRNDYVHVEEDGSFRPLRAPAEYIIRLLHLNRAIVCRLRMARENAHRLVPRLEARIAWVDRALQRQDLSDEDRSELLCTRTELSKAIDEFTVRLDFSLH